MFDPEKPHPFPGIGVASKLGRNLQGYAGETIDLTSVLTECADAARRHGWRIDTIPLARGPGLLALARTSHQSSGRSAKATQARRRVYISAGIHGDEPAGPLAARELLVADAWPKDLDLWLCPCLNPAGFSVNRRENADGVDLNRDYLKPKTDEILGHTEWLRRQPDFDLSLCLHEDWEALGFYLYELNPEARPSLAESIVARVANVCPIDLSNSIEGRPAQGGIIRPNPELQSRPQWPEAFFLLSCKTRLSYTLEAPSDFPLPVRVAALVAGVMAAVA